MSLQHLLPEGLDDGFGHWLAGFIDGEGCFSITEDRRTGHFVCRFTIGLRADDAPILKEASKRTGCGTFTPWYPPSLRVGKTSPQAMWSVHRKDDCLRLVAILERFPLRAKKARDFEVWRTAVVEWTRGDQRRMKGLKKALETVRKYREDPITAVHVSPQPAQPELGELV